jgi:hypothetical protein
LLGPIYGTLEWAYIPFFFLVPVCVQFSPAMFRLVDQLLRWFGPPEQEQWVVEVLIFFFRFVWPLVCESLQGDVSIALESPDQKTRGFVV